MLIDRDFAAQLGHETVGIFHEALAGPFDGGFEDVVFAITDWSPERRFIGPFAARFGD